MRRLVAVAHQRDNPTLTRLRHHTCRLPGPADRSPTDPSRSQFLHAASLMPVLRSFPDRTSLPCGSPHMTTTHEQTIVVGKFVVSPLVTATDSGRYAASAAICSGKGRGTHHRVLRFVPRFDSRDIARRYAADNGVAYAAALLRQLES